MQIITYPLRIDEDLWARVKSRAALERRTAANAIRELLEDYVNQKQAPTKIVARGAKGTK